MNTKRILSITVKSMFDESPDTSHLGEYSSKPKGDYSIDRRHSLDCPVNNPQTVEPIVSQLERIIRYLDIERLVRTETYDTHSGTIADDIGTAQDILIEAQDRTAECDCDESGNCGRHEYQYFNTSGNYTGESLADIVTYTKQDYARMEDLNNQGWYYLGIRAEAEVQLTGDLCQDITSGGLWGIESDSGSDYLKEVEEEELSSLKAELKALGFGSRAISAAFKNVEHKSD